MFTNNLEKITIRDYIIAFPEWRRTMHANRINLMDRKLTERPIAEL